MQQMALILHQHFPTRRIPTRVLPNWAAVALSYLDPSLASVRAEIGKTWSVDSSRIRSVLAWKPRGLEEMVVAMAERLIAEQIA
jgi:hypothetical protein